MKIQSEIRADCRSLSSFREIKGGCRGDKRNQTSCLSCSLFQNNRPWPDTVMHKVVNVTTKPCPPLMHLYSKAGTSPSSKSEVLNRINHRTSPSPRLLHQAGCLELLCHQRGPKHILWSARWINKIFLTYVARQKWKDIYIYIWES